jgi:hypothetical protein
MHHGLVTGPTAGKKSLDRKLQTLATETVTYYFENEELRAEIARLKLSIWAKFKLWLKAKLGR